MSISMEGEDRRELDKASSVRISKLLGPKILVKVELTDKAQTEFSKGRLAPAVSGSGITFKRQTHVNEGRICPNLDFNCHCPFKRLS